VNNTVDGLLRLLYPDPKMEVPAESLSWAASLAVETRRRVKEAQAFIGVAEFGSVDLSFSIDGGVETVVYCEESLRHRLRSGGESRHSATRDSDVLPQPDPAEVKSSVGARASDYAVGDVIDGRFEVLEVLGQGGFSKVYRVHDELEDADRAFKLFNSAAGYEAVRREIAALRKVHHPNVVEVFWAGKTNAGDWFLVTEYIEGESLDAYATGQRHLRDREAIDVVRDILDALIAIHPNSGRLLELDAKNKSSELTKAEYEEWRDLQEKGLVHRDIKPLNIMLTRTGAKLLDFNIASRVGDPVRTQSGTPPYQAPDADLTRWDVSTDLFAVGVVLYQLICNGTHPYPNSRPIVGNGVIDPLSIRPDLDGPLAEFLIRACASSRNERYSTANEMKEALDALRRT
jgi:serine/threonine protein kinase